MCNYVCMCDTVTPWQGKIAVANYLEVKFINQIVDTCIINKEIAYEILKGLGKHFKEYTVLFDDFRELEINFQQLPKNFISNMKS